MAINLNLNPNINDFSQFFRYFIKDSLYERIKTSLFQKDIIDKENEVLNKQALDLLEKYINLENETINNIINYLSSDDYRNLDEWIYSVENEIIEEELEQEIFLLFIEIFIPCLKNAIKPCNLLEVGFSNPSKMKDYLRKMYDKSDLFFKDKLQLSIIKDYVQTSINAF